MSPRFRLLRLAWVPTLGAAIWWASARFSPPDDAPREILAPRIEATPLCPWREPADDLRAWFPEATDHRAETRILSGQRLALAERLGRMPDAEEHALQIHRVYQGSTALGVVLIRRVKGECGAIEIVLAATPEGRVRGLRLQRIREPQAVREELQRAEWLGAFAGTELAGDWTLARGVPPVNPGAQVSAAAVADGVRSLLVLYATARETPPSLVRHHS